MAVYRSKGIVLRSIRYGEADRILDLYTQDVGLVSVIAKGIRRTKSRFGGRLEPLSCVDFLAYEGRTLDTVTQVEVLRSFHGVRENLKSLEAAGGMVANVRAFSGGDEADRRVFNLLYHALDALDARTRDTMSIEAAFSLKLSILAGYAIRLDACISCERDPEEAAEGDHPYFAPPLGGMLCADCRSATADSFPLPTDTLAALQNLVVCPIREAAVEKRLEESVRRVVSAHVLAHAPGTPGNALLTAPNPRTLRPA
ncbi:MAG TPA: DNA repair protein RecO [Rubrobacteraceae bacterium]|nr:DNA repair protein RecO [Rubrobacteraceae bacterium]